MPANFILELIESTKNEISFNCVIETILKKIQDHTGFEAVGIRVENKIGDYPYFVYKGFSDDFIQVENSLCQQNSDGNIICGKDGNPVLECMCGNIIRKKINPIFPFFTNNGSFFSNSTTELLASTTEKDRLARTRNRCNTEGYESLGLFPLDIGEENIGLLQLNDKRKNMFTPEKIKEYEKIARYIAGRIYQAKIIKGLQNRLLSQINNSS